jgi:hypothetical protein
VIGIVGVLTVAAGGAVVVGAVGLRGGVVAPASTFDASSVPARSQTPTPYPTPTPTRAEGEKPAPVLAGDCGSVLGSDDLDVDMTLSENYGVMNMLSTYFRPDWTFVRDENSGIECAWASEVGGVFVEVYPAKLAGTPDDAPCEPKENESDFPMCAGTLGDANYSVAYELWNYEDALDPQRTGALEAALADHLAGWPAPQLEADAVGTWPTPIDCDDIEIPADSPVGSHPTVDDIIGMDAPTPTLAVPFMRSGSNTLSCSWYGDHRGIDVHPYADGAWLAAEAAASEVGGVEEVTVPGFDAAYVLAIGPNGVGDETLLLTRGPNALLVTVGQEPFTPWYGTLTSIAGQLDAMVED